VLWILDNRLIYTYIHFFCKYILYIETPRSNTNRHVHANKCLHCAGIEPATSCVVDEYSHHYATSAVNTVLDYGNTILQSSNWYRGNPCLSISLASWHLWNVIPWFSHIKHISRTTLKNVRAIPFYPAFARSSNKLYNSVDTFIMWKKCMVYPPLIE
jgi:hypothetical protein